MKLHSFSKHFAILLGLLALFGVGPALAQDNPFAQNWTLVPASSSLTFLSTKNQTTVETNKFSNIVGGIDANGAATIKVQLNSIDTGIDLRNVRMRFLFFEVFKYPDLIITAHLDPAQVSDLKTVRRKQMQVPVDVELHGAKQSMPIDMTVTLISDTTVSVASTSPIPIDAKLFGLEAGVQRLQEAANVTLLPSGSVSFDLLFEQGGEGPPVGTTAAVDPRSTAIESKGDLTVDECVNRFETMSKAEAIFFDSGSARLDNESRDMLDEVKDIVQRCPNLNIMISGHTDSRGSDDANQTLSEQRAGSVRDYLVAHGVAGDRLQWHGYGETQPAFPNDTAENRARNRRIEFSVMK